MKILEVVAYGTSFSEGTNLDVIGDDLAVGDQLSIRHPTTPIQAGTVVSLAGTEAVIEVGGVRWLLQRTVVAHTEPDNLRRRSWRIDRKAE